MIRETIEPRRGWRATVEAEGLIWHTADGRPYWNEAACYRFTPAQVATIEAATAELYRLFLVAGDAIVGDRAMLRRFGIPEAFHGPIADAWNAEPPALDYGRFDLGYDGQGAPKLFEFNCDTPTSLLEAAVIQWTWKEERFPHADQFNSIHDRLVARWSALRGDLPATVHFAHVADDEDAVTTAYLRDTAQRAGLATVPILIDDLGWDGDARCFVDTGDRRIAALFKLYPWEWLANEAFAPQLLDSLAHGETRWLEPVWKMIWSNKGILPVLDDLFPGHPNLLAAAWSPPADADAVAKPLLAREGANVSLRRAGTIVAETGGDYGDEGYVFQELYPLPQPAPGIFPVIGSWVVGGEPAGMGIREDGLITGNGARFVPHVIAPAVRGDSL
ncbi:MULTISPECIES: glutathionylspermidine synthase family protein [Sphingomonas]|uniref:glutathionylspermidine synthase family protein n=1 Tax=Sphingomonas TaxID=13687 RepID=UPI000833EF71|nr:MULTISPECIES: glutathionylspermidine synthase family protein [Sphingomonas]MBY0300706.1 glutathionylspermidine synthase family protein [Sphingomonas ginsenosidimutans]